MSTLKVDTLSDTAAAASVPIEDVINGSARAWVNFNGTGTVAIRAQYNVASITDNGTGNYTVNFTNAMSDANYAWTITTEHGDGTSSSTAPHYLDGGTLTSSAIQFLTELSSGTNQDKSYVVVTIFR